MSVFLKEFLVEDARKLGGAGRRHVVVGAFGKHPAWDDHFDLGLTSATLQRTRELLYVNGISSLIDRGVWDELDEGRCIERFNHVFAWVRGDKMLLGRMFFSKDGKNRQAYPFVACVQLAGATLAWAVENVVPPLIDLPNQLDLSDEDQINALIKQIHTDPSAREGIQASIDAHLDSLRRELHGRLDSATQLRPQVDAADWERFVTSPELVDGGRPSAGLERVVYRLAERYGWPEAGAPSTADPDQFSDMTMRVPRAASRLETSFELWRHVAANLAPPNLPVFMSAQLSSSWLDLVIGEPGADAFFGLRAGAGAVPLENEIAYSMDDATQSRCARLIDDMKVEPVVAGESQPDAQVGGGRDATRFPWIGVGAAVAVAVISLLFVLFKGKKDTAVQGEDPDTNGLAVAVSGPTNETTPTPGGTNLSSATNISITNAVASVTNTPAGAVQRTNRTNILLSANGTNVTKTNLASKTNPLTIATNAPGSNTLVGATNRPSGVRSKPTNLISQTQSPLAVSANRTISNSLPPVKTPTNNLVVTSPPPALKIPGSVPQAVVVKTNEPNASAPRIKTSPSPAEAKGEPPWQNSLGMKFVPVPGTDVLFSIWETRRQDYAKFRAAQPDAKDNWHQSNPDPTHPVLFITWKNANAFCEWLTQHERALGAIGSTQRYRLPRDAEWSAAVGLPTERGETPYSRKKNHENDKAYKEHHPNATETLNGNYADRTAFEKYGSIDGWTYLHKVHKNLEYRDGFASTAPVGSFQPNKLGIYDLGGNAEEWCAEVFAGPGATKRQHFVRGASYREAFLPNTFSTHRFAVRSDLEGDYKQGFRIVLEGVGRAPAAIVKPHDHAVAPTNSNTPPPPPPRPDPPGKPQMSVTTATNVAVVDGASPPVVKSPSTNENAPIPVSTNKTTPSGPLKPVKSAAPSTVVEPAPIPVKSVDPTPAPRLKPQNATVQRPWENSLGMKFVPVGNVLFSVWETRRKDYAVFRAQEQDDSDRWSGGSIQPDHPVAFITWQNANAFCQWLTRRERASGSISHTFRYRLPRDLEWSQAVGLPPEPGDTPYDRHDNHDKDAHPNWNGALGGNYSDVSAEKKYGSRGGRVYVHKVQKIEYEDGYADTSPVDAFKPNQFGIYNLGGNVAEWIDESYGGPGVLKRQHFVRGASFMDGHLARTTSGFRVPVSRRNEGGATHGFRVVLDRLGAVLSPTQGRSGSPGGEGQAPVVAAASPSAEGPLEIHVDPPGATVFYYSSAQRKEVTNMKDGVGSIRAREGESYRFVAEYTGLSPESKTVRYSKTRSVVKFELKYAQVQVEKVSPDYMRVLVNGKEQKDPLKKWILPSDGDLSVQAHADGFVPYQTNWQSGRFPEKLQLKMKLAVPLQLELLWVPVKDGGRPWPGENGEGVWVGRYEVTQQQFQKLLGVNPSHYSRQYFADLGPQAPGAWSDSFPVDSVSPADCEEFVHRLNREPRPTGWKYSLMTPGLWDQIGQGAAIGSVIARGTKGPISVSDTAMDPKSRLHGLQGNLAETTWDPSSQSFWQKGRSFSDTKDPKIDPIRLDKNNTDPKRGFRVLLVPE